MRAHEDEHDIFEEWLYSACEHPRRDFCQVRISNWGGHRSFQLALEETGDQVKSHAYFIMGGYTPADFHYAVAIDKDSIYVAEYSDPPRILLALLF